MNDTDNIETEDDPTTVDQVLNIAGYVGLATITIIMIKKVVRVHRRRKAEVLVACDEAIASMPNVMLTNAA